MKQFVKEDRATWRYFWAHWFAVQMVAITVGAWKFKYLFHDWYKPWLKMFGVKYSKIQQYHRHHSKHHPEWLLSRLEKMDLRRESAYDLFDKFNWEEMLMHKTASPFKPKDGDNNYDKKYCESKEQVSESTIARYKDYMNDEEYA
jgi:hypothetical protein